MGLHSFPSPSAPLPAHTLPKSHRTVRKVYGRCIVVDQLPLHAMQTLQSDIFKGEFKYFFQARDLSKI